MKLVKPDDFSGVYQKGKRDSSRPYVSGGGDSTNASEGSARLFGAILLVLSISFCVISFLGTLSVIVWDFQFWILSFGFINVLMVMGETGMRRDIPQRNWIMGLLWGSIPILGILGLWL